MSLLNVSGLCVEYRDPAETVYAVNGVGVELSDGEIVALVGESGSGKTATVLAILGLLRPPGVVTAGEILFAGADVRGLSGEQLRKLRGSRLSYVPQAARLALNPLLRIDAQMENVIRAHEPGAKNTARNRCQEALASVGIQDPQRVLRAHPHELSGGMAQRVVIAIALLLNPALVIADEPTTGLDVTVQAQILELLVSGATERGAAAILVTHDLGVVANYCQRVMVMYGGRIVESGSTEDIFARPQHPYTQGLLLSVPVVGEPLYHMEGQSPHLHEPPVACTFAPRCPYATDECSASRPPWFRSGGHAVFCHHPAHSRAVVGGRP
jgi:peptide/nickel transport system ATP-binding protein